MLPSAHVTVTTPLALAERQLPCVVFSVFSAPPAGSGSVSVTPDAADGPPFRTVTVSVSSLYFLTGAGESVLVTDRSAPEKFPLYARTTSTRLNGMPPTPISGGMGLVGSASVIVLAVTL